MIRVKSASAVPAMVVARVDHGAGARSVGKDVGQSVAMIFGNPAAGTPVTKQNRLAGAIRPLQVLVYQDTDGNVWLAHEDLGDRLDDLDGIDDDDLAARTLEDALTKLVGTAATA